MKKVLAFTLMLILALDFGARPAYAYLDPGAGSQLLQMTLAGVLGGLFALKTLVARVLQVLRARRAK